MHAVLHYLRAGAARIIKAAVRANASLMEAILEGRRQRARIETELYGEDVIICSKSDDDLPIKASAAGLDRTRKNEFAAGEQRSCPTAARALRAL